MELKFRMVTDLWCKYGVIVKWIKVDYKAVYCTLCADIVWFNCTIITFFHIL
jgi:hypothetical protein